MLVYHWYHYFIQFPATIHVLSSSYIIIYNRGKNKYKWSVINRTCYPCYFTDIVCLWLELQHLYWTENHICLINTFESIASNPFCLQEILYTYKRLADIFNRWWHVSSNYSNSIHVQKTWWYVDDDTFIYLPK